MFQDWREKDLTSNQITIMIVDKIPMINEDKVNTISTKPDEAVNLEKG